MSSTLAYLAIVLVLSSLEFLPVSHGLSPSSATIANSGTIESPNLRNAVIAYRRANLNTAEVEFVADHFDLLLCDFIMGQPTLQALKDLNPDLVAFGYKDLILMDETYEDWSTVNANEEWFVHDVNGNRVHWLNSTSVYGMNPGNAQWRAYFVDYVKSKIAAGNYDGVFLDDVWVACYFQNVPDEIRVPWYSSILGFLQYIRANIGSDKIALINSNEYEVPDSTFISATGAGMIEGFVHQDWTDPSVNRPTALIMQMIDRLYLDSGNGRMVFCLSGTRPGTDEENARLVKYCFAGYLLGVNGGKAYYGFFLPRTGSVLTDWYFPLNDMDMGSPTNAYYADQNVYMRDFTNGKVLFNPSSSSYTVNLGGTYKLLDGTIVSSLTINACSGEILLR